MKQYKIKEIFYSIQGEGRNSGRAAVFVRFAGCNLKCPFCDTDWTGGVSLTAGDIVEAAVNAAGKNTPELLILTGGEPTLQIDEVLCDRLHTKFPEIAIETNGTRLLPRGIDFVTVSPKSDFVGFADVVLNKADELKLVYNGRLNPETWRNRIDAKYYYLQPCDTGMLVDSKTEACVKYIEKHPWWRLSLQTQKFINVR